MNDEIKEILDNIDIWYKENDLDYSRWFGLEELKQLKDYITNLQQENERLNTELNTYKDEFCKDTIKKYELVMEQEYYKSRCEEAIEFIKEIQLGVDSMDRPVMLLDQIEGRDLLKILGGDKNE